jgi:xanthine/uracil permease
MFFTGLGNVFAGCFGVIGPVNYSLSTGVISSSGCASRFTLLPTAAIMFILAFFPIVIGLIGSVPPVVIGAVLAYVMTSQVASGLIVVFKGVGDKGLGFENGLVVGLSMLLGTIISFLPQPVIQILPPVLKPTLGNGFVVGVMSALVLEHMVFRKR